MRALAAVPLALLAVLPAADEDWDAVFADALRLRSSESEERARLLGELDAIAERNVETVEGDLLACWLRLERTPGRVPSAQTRPVAADASAAEWPYEGVATWIAAEVIPPSPARARAIVRALALEREPTRAQLDLAWRYGIELATERLWLDDAIVVQGGLHRRYDAHWSALNLATTLHRAGRLEEADAVLARRESEHGESLTDAQRHELWSNRGLFALGRGDERAACDWLGRALALGSLDAALMLAREDLADDEFSRARAGFRALLLDEEPHAWALRGWGIALLPGAARD